MTKLWHGNGFGITVTVACHCFYYHICVSIAPPLPCVNIIHKEGAGQWKHEHNNKNTGKRLWLLSLCEGKPPVTAGFPSHWARSVQLLLLLCHWTVQTAEQLVSCRWLVTPRLPYYVMVMTTPYCLRDSLIHQWASFPNPEIKALSPTKYMQNYGLANCFVLNNKKSHRYCTKFTRFYSNSALCESFPFRISNRLQNLHIFKYHNSIRHSHPPTCQMLVIITEGR